MLVPNFEKTENEPKERKTKGYHLVDFDHTMATYTTFLEQGTALGKPIPVMIERIQRWLHSGQEVRIFTARACRYNLEEIESIRQWCKLHIGKELPIQNWKDFDCISIWDDRAVSVEANTGWRENPHAAHLDPLHSDEETDLLEAWFEQTEQENELFVK